MTRQPAVPPRWTAVFNRSTIHSRVFYVKPARLTGYGDATPNQRIEERLIDLGVPHRLGSTRGWWDVWRHAGFGFLDGGFASRFGDNGYLFNGAYVIGYRALRFLCGELSLTPPRPLKNEPRPVPTHEDLRAELHSQLEDQTEATRLHYVADTLYRVTSGAELREFAEGDGPLARYTYAMGDLETGAGPALPDGTDPDQAASNSMMLAKYASTIAMQQAQVSPDRQDDVREEEPAEDTSGLTLCLDCHHLKGTYRDREHRCRCQTRDDTWKRKHWEGYDLPEKIELCFLCARATMGSGSRWTWLACDSCRKVNDAIGTAIAGETAQALPLGRHSIMNGQALSGKDVGDEGAIDRFAAAGGTMMSTAKRLSSWRSAEITRLAEGQGLDPSEIGLDAWLASFPTSLGASMEAFCRFTSFEAHDLPGLDELWDARAEFLAGHRPSNS